ncbi:hypothetical protein [Demequina aurantiaca]|uniref:hypothetical protein n=1 Tax=Demequina aurantiaca TaxID=676200 RepID=UPI0007851E58|nr:hypothetical protein [Demequina aurantiaca]
MKPQPKPVTGAIFGFLLGIVMVALLWQLGILPPDRLVVFGIVAIVMMVSTFALTQRVSLVRKRFVVVVVFAALFGGVGLTGIPEFVGGGSISDGCTIEASSSLSDTTSPADTSATAPFKAALSDDVPWTMTTSAVVTTGTNAAGLKVAGFEIPTYQGTVDNAAGVEEISGTANVQAVQDQLKDDSGLSLTGVYHVYGYVHAAEGDCDVDGYVLVAPASAFGNSILVGLWVLAAILFIVIVTLAIGVRRSIRTSERLAATTPPTGVSSGSETSTSAPIVAATATNAETPADQQSPEYAPQADDTQAALPAPTPGTTDEAVAEPGAPTEREEPTAAPQVDAASAPEPEPAAVSEPVTEPASDEAPSSEAQEEPEADSAAEPVTPTEASDTPDAPAEDEPRRDGDDTGHQI